MASDGEGARHSGDGDGYGYWPSAVSAALVAQCRTSRSTLRTLGGEVFWVESRPQEGGRQVVMRGRPAREPVAVDLGEHSVRSRVHEYGGGAFCIVGGPTSATGTAGTNSEPSSAEPSIAFVDQADQRVYLHASLLSGPGGDSRVGSGAKPPSLRALTGPGSVGERWYHGDLWPTPDGRWVLAVRERHLEDRVLPQRGLVAIPVAGPTAGATQPGGSGEAAPGEVVLWEGSDFVAAPRPDPFWSPDHPHGCRLAWITWDHPNMPWDGTSLWVGVLATDSRGRLRVEQAERIAGGASESIGMPTWCGDGSLVFLSDRCGWWQPWRWEPGNQPHRLCEREVEFHTPDWQLGQIALGRVGHSELACRWREGDRDQLGVLDIGAGALRTIPQPCTSITAIAPIAEGVVWLGATPWSVTEPWWAGFDAELRSPQFGSAQPLCEHGSGVPGIDASSVSIGQLITVQHSTANIPAVFYPPINPSPGRVTPSVRQATTPPPLIVHCHGGPTGQSDTGLDLVVQYFTSRGFAVVHVDYRGSSGYGRTFRRALDGKWGVADVEDCVAVAESLARTGKVDGRHMAIRGGSAGGLTALGALIGRTLFAAVTSWYGVTDLLGLVASTHDFEAHYTDRLVGELPEATEEYRRRSPLYRAAEMDGAVLVLQGLDDPVVPPEQSSSMIEELRRNGRRCEYRTFAGEGHGFRRAETIETCLETELAFYREVMNLQSPAG